MDSEPGGGDVNHVPHAFTIEWGGQCTNAATSDERQLFRTSAVFPNVTTVTAPSDRRAAYALTSSRVMVA